MLLNPKTAKFEQMDERSREIMRKTIDFFERKGKLKCKEDLYNRVWYEDFLDFIKENRIFADLLTPRAYGGEHPDARWDTSRICDFSEILGFYGLGPGPYLVLLVAGPYNLRDATGWGVDLVAYNLVMNELYQELAIKGRDKDVANWGLLALFAIDKRHKYSFRYFMTGSPFEYEIVRKFYQVYREFLIEN